ncbi:glycoside hydrolase domain-containing protein [Caballeronia sp. S22]|uniref:glycoside hydrolase domain-containing protein n=1 Tax=Caballeronia sp. S22 TaxID=3137182 RepID=UPI003530BAF5
MPEGLSTNRKCEKYATCLADQLQFVIRYYSRTTQDPEKRISASEANALSGAGIDIVVVYQDRAREMVDFSHHRGEQDGQSAFEAAGAIGQPHGSAIYFAVDTDVSKDQIAAYVVSYFQGLTARISQLSGGAPYYRIGVYGSGRTCATLKSAGLVQLTRLAEATGWGGSRAYQDWDIKQFVTAKPLCGLKSGAWQRCVTSKDDFGAFKPIGAVAGGKTKPSLLKVIADNLNLRNVPTREGNTPIAVLPHGAQVEMLGQSAPDWARVKATLNGSEFTGHVHTGYLEPMKRALAAPGKVVALPKLPEAYWKLDNKDARRTSTSSRASVIGESGAPRRSDATGAKQVKMLTAILQWLDVAVSERYQKSDGKTFCNVYAADYCYLAGVYLPRVWWTGSAIAMLAKGQKVVAAYDTTVREMRADDLYRWLLDFGESFGWTRFSDLTELQAIANAGGVGVICADRATDGLPGHISVVVPETEAHKADRDAAGNVTQPLQSQAGGTNYMYGSAGPHWWLGKQFVGHVFFAHV